jgi:hypothetical protein
MLRKRLFGSECQTIQEIKVTQFAYPTIPWDIHVFITGEDKRLRLI